MSEPILFHCNCIGHHAALGVTHFEEGRIRETYIGFYVKPNFTNDGLLWRLRLAWRVLRYGLTSLDEVCLTQEQTQKLKDAL